MDTPLDPAATLGKVINQVLSLDEETRTALVKYAGSVIAIELQNTEQAFTIHITPAGIEVSGAASVVPDVTIRGTPSQLLAYLAAVQREEPGRSGSIEINGNIALAQKIIGILRNLDLDWEQKLSEWVGDSIAHASGTAIRNTLKLARYAGNTLRGNISEYLRFESGAVPDRAEIDQFNSAIDVLRNDVERLKLRISRLQQTLAKD